MKSENGLHPKVLATLATNNFNVALISQFSQFSRGEP